MHPEQTSSAGPTSHNQDTQPATLQQDCPHRLVPAVLASQDHRGRRMGGRGGGSARPPNTAAGLGRGGPGRTGASARAAALLRPAGAAPAGTKAQLRNGRDVGPRLSGAPLHSTPSGRDDIITADGPPDRPLPGRRRPDAADPGRRTTRPRRVGVRTEVGRTFPAVQFNPGGTWTRQRSSSTVRAALSRVTHDES
jgi:hypothetical protein